MVLPSIFFVLLVYGAVGSSSTFLSRGTSWYSRPENDLQPNVRSLFASLGEFFVDASHAIEFNMEQENTLTYYVSLLK